MIQVDIVDYDKLSKVGMHITQYINSNLRDIVRVLKDILETDPDFEMDGFFPRDYLQRKPQECRNAVDELYELICSMNIRDYLKPKYEYLLYSILCWWEDVADSKDDLIINEVDDKLKSELDSEEGKHILKQIKNFEEYYYICFQDHDFLPDQLNSMVMLYLQDPRLVEMFFHYDNLDDYINLMECDLRERYIEIRNDNGIEINNSVSMNIIKEFVNVIRRFQKRIAHFEKRDEVEITADIQDSVAAILNSKYRLHIAREFTMGRAIKKLGETDLYIYVEEDGRIIDYAILENKYIEKFTAQYNQLMGYLNPNFQFGITLSMNRVMSMKKGFDFIEEQLKNIEGNFKPCDIRRVGEKDTLMIISEHIVPETGNQMKIFHLILQLNDIDRKKVAVQARKL